MGKGRPWTHWTVFYYFVSLWMLEFSGKNKSWNSLDLWLLFHDDEMVYNHGKGKSGDSLDSVVDLWLLLHVLIKLVLSK
jgi:hypothetical protein